MLLFDDVPHMDLTSVRHTMPYVDYLNRSADKKFARIRHLLQHWFDHFPEKDQTDLKFQLRSERGFDSAFFVLFLHEMLKRLGHTIIHHPTAPKGTRPDFLVSTPDSSEYYLEAVLATGQSNEEAAAERQLNLLRGELKRLVDSSDFTLYVDTQGLITQLPSLTKLADAVRRWLNTLDSSEIAQQYRAEVACAWPTYESVHKGFKVVVCAVPKVVPLGPVSVFAPQSVAPIRNAVEDKATKYGQLALPYIVAVNAVGTCTDEEDALDALIGSEQTELTWPEVDLTQVTQKRVRARDGAWLGLGGAKNTRVSGVLIVTRLTAPESLFLAEMVLLHNPWSAKPCLSVLSELPRWVPEKDCLRRTSGLTVADLLELPKLWPEHKP